MQPRYRFTRHIPAYRASFGLRHENAGSSSHTAESSSLYCGPPVRIQLLSTPPRGDAVTFSYRALAYPDTDFHRANVAPSRAHIPRPLERYSCWMSEYIRMDHNVSVLLYHLVFPAKYRRVVIDEQVEMVLKEACVGVELRYEISSVPTLSHWSVVSQ